MNEELVMFIEGCNNNNNDLRILHSDDLDACKENNLTDDFCMTNNIDIPNSIAHLTYEKFYNFMVTSYYQSFMD